MDNRDRRRSDGAAQSTSQLASAVSAKGPVPAMQVVGFRVEGVQPSPESQNNFLTSDHGPLGTGSPTPVIIPPSIQALPREGGAARSTTADAAAMGEIIPPNTTSAGGAPPTSTALQRTAMPLQQEDSKVSSDGGAVPSSEPKPIMYADRAEAAHAGLTRPESVTSDGTSTTVSNVSTSVFQRSESDAHFKPLAGATTTTPSTSAAQHPAKGTSVPTSTNTTHRPGPAKGQQPPQQQQQTAGSTSAGGAAAGQQGPGTHPTGERKYQKDMTRAERRALQEAQKAAKAQARESSAGGGKPSAGGAKPGPGSVASQPAAKPDAKTASKAKPADTDKSAGGAPRHTTEGGVAAAAAPGAGHDHGAAKVKKQGTKVVSLNSTELFAHLPQYKKATIQTLMSHRDAANMHPAVLQLGLRYADGSITGASARCMAMLHTFCQVIHDYNTPEGKVLSRDLQQHLNGIISFLVECRPLAVSMGNAIKFLKMRIAQIDPSLPDDEAKENLITEIKDFIRNRIEQADKFLIELAAQKVESGDVILTFAYSHVVTETLLKARAEGKQFRAVVVDSRPELEGLLTLKKLQAAGIACTYALFNALSFVMRDVSKVFLGASAVMSNGTVMGRAGNAAVAMMAHAHSKPVIVCCESFKFHERVQLDAITHNELGDPDALTTVPGRPDVTALKDWKGTPRLGLLNLKFDAMPAEYVTAIVTEHAMIPPTSVPVIIREYQQYVREM